MKNDASKPPKGMTRKQEKEAARHFGHHVSGEKALCAVIVSTLCCALPMLLGLRLWERIPAIVETGLVGPSGTDDSMPRAVLVFGVPGLGCVLNLIEHAQLWLHQRREKIPPVPIRVLGRWSIAPISLLLSSLWILRAAGESMSAGFLLSCALGLLLMLLGGHLFDCPRDSALAFRLERIRYSQPRWRLTHRVAGLCWMGAGLLIPTALFLGWQSPWLIVPAALLLLCPLAVGLTVR